MTQLCEHPMSHRLSGNICHICKKVFPKKTLLDDHIQKMRACASAAVRMMNKADAEEMAASVTEDVVIKTITMMRDHPEWYDEAWKRAVIRSPLPKTAKKGRKTPIYGQTPNRGEAKNIMTL